MLADLLAGILDRLAFFKSPSLRTNWATLRHTGVAVPLRPVDPLADVDEDAFVLSSVPARR
nr:hypothetical protein [Mycobacterium uberis]